MVPDILGFELEDGLSLLAESGIAADDIVIDEYFSPKKDIIGNKRRIVRIKFESGKVVLTVSYF